MKTLLLMQTINGKAHEEVVQYSNEEMVEMFSAEEIASLQIGRTIRSASGFRWVDLVAAYKADK